MSHIIAMAFRPGTLLSSWSCSVKFKLFFQQSEPQHFLSCFTHILPCSIYLNTAIQSFEWRWHKSRSCFDSSSLISERILSIFTNVLCFFYCCQCLPDSVNSKLSLWSNLSNSLSLWSYSLGMSPLSFSVCLLVYLSL